MKENNQRNVSQQIAQGQSIDRRPAVNHSQLSEIAHREHGVPDMETDDALQLTLPSIEYSDLASPTKKTDKSPNHQSKQSPNKSKNVTNLSNLQQRETVAVNY